MEIYLVLQKFMEMNEKGNWEEKSSTPLFAFKDKDNAKKWCKKQNKFNNEEMTKMKDANIFGHYYKWNHEVKRIGLY